MNISYIRKEFEAIADLIEKKNKDYGDAFAEATKLFRDYPASKIYEKTKRIIRLSKEGNAVQGEGLTDALRDCIGYCALLLDLLEQGGREGVAVPADKGQEVGPIKGYAKVKKGLKGHPREIMEAVEGKEVVIVDFMLADDGTLLYKVPVLTENYNFALLSIDEIETIKRDAE